MDKFSISSFRQAKLPSENDIMAPWTGSKPIVSVICITFNHKYYIEDAIRGFLLQKTSFPFEIIIHDDASTDTTQGIILSYANKYPNLIKPVFQKFNQYSKGVKPTALAVGYSQGEYLALCEGDDFWLSQDKLQRQIDALNIHPECNICFHPAKMLFQNGQSLKMADYSEEVEIVSVDKVISADGSFCPTASLVFKREVFDNLPTWFYEKAPVGDYYLQVFGSLNGGALFLPFEMSLYRSFSSGSWSESMYQKGKNRLLSYFDRTIECLSELDKYTDYKYSASISRAKSLQAFSIAILFLKKKNIKDFYFFIRTSWSYCPSLLITQLFALFKKIILRMIKKVFFSN